MGMAKYANGFRLTLHPDTLADPLKWKKPRSIFLCSMSDWCHPAVPDEFIQRISSVMRQTPWHTYVTVTKRAERLAQIAPKLPWPPNVIAGVTVESAKYTFRVDCLRQVPAATRLLMVEPLLGPIPNLDLSGIGWVVVGGESGTRARPMNPDWVRDIRAQCLAAGVPLRLKQLSGPHGRKAGCELDGRVWDERPACFCSAIAD
jgi:protein gp37